MKLFRYVWLLMLLAGLLFVSAAFASETAAPQGKSEAVVALADECDDESGTSDLIDGLPDAALSPGQSDDQACRDCHTNEDLLKELAVEEEVENLSEGPG